MFVECKGGWDLTGPGRIRRVRRSKTGRTLYLGDRALQSLKGAGYKANYYDTESGERYWISRPKRDGQDTLYSGVVEVDEDARVEYWEQIRGQPELVALTSFRSDGKHARWRKRQFEAGTRRR